MKMRLTQRLVFFVVFAVSFPIALVVVGHHLHAPQQAAVSATSSRGPDLSGQQRAMDATVAALMVKHDCAPPDLWKSTRPGRYPKTMLLQRDRSFAVSVRVWTYPAPAGYWTLGLCGK